MSLPKNPVPFEAFGAFCRRYERATSFIQETYGLSRIQTFERVRRDRRAFEKFKFLSKCLFLRLFAAPTETMNQRVWRVDVIEHAGALWERRRFNTCPKMKWIHDNYLTDVKANPCSFEIFS